MINRETLLNWEFPDIRQSYGWRDTVLYALGLGLGTDPLDPAQLRFVFEDGLHALPTMGLTLGYPGLWLSDERTGADWRQMLHGEQSIEIMRPLPAEGRVVGRTRVMDVIDKGPGKGALVFTERTLLDEDTGELLCRMASTSFLRGDGGFGGPSGPVPRPHPIPDRAPDREVMLKTLPQAALIYRLSGDYNPLHVDPELARSAGFERPILHGLCTFGIAGYAVLAGAAGGDPGRIGSIAARFTAPVYPGETVATAFWLGTQGAVAFRSRVLERGVTVLNNGHALLV